MILYFSLYDFINFSNITLVKYLYLKIQIDFFERF